MESMKTGEELSTFDGLFERIDEVATRPSGEAVHDEDPCLPHEGTRLTPVRMIGQTAVKFMIFSSKTRSEESGKLLYEPSITVFRSDSEISDHIKRIDIDARPNSGARAERHEQLLAKLEAAQELFDKYEQSTGD